ncbi:MAG: hypothetical protein U5J82_04740 [Desulfobacterales bacterium]|nr:hypothetical protein [Desulfobacterales bacterium]
MLLESETEQIKIRDRFADRSHGIEITARFIVDLAEDTSRPVEDTP